MLGWFLHLIFTFKKEQKILSSNGCTSLNFGIFTFCTELERNKFQIRALFSSPATIFFHSFHSTPWFFIKNLHRNFPVRCKHVCQLNNYFQYNDFKVRSRHEQRFLFSFFLTGGKLVQYANGMLLTVRVVLGCCWQSR